MSKGLFSNATVVKAPAPKSRKVEAEKVPLAGMERFAAIKAAIETLSALALVEEAQLKSQMGDMFVNEAFETKKRPTNFTGIDGHASGSCQLKIRSSASVLTEEERETLAEAKIPFGTEVKTEEAFIINPIYTNDMDLLGKVEKALSKIDLPADFLMKQEKVEKHIVDEETLTAVFKADEAILATLLPMVTTMAIKPKIEGDFWPILDAIMAPVEETKGAAKAA